MGYTTMYGKLCSDPMIDVNVHVIDTAFDSPAGI